MRMCYPPHIGRSFKQHELNVRSTRPRPEGSEPSGLGVCRQWLQGRQLSNCSPGRLGHQLTIEGDR